MIVYHGTDSSSAANILANGIDVKYGDDSVDNGKGFYMTPSYEFALNRAKSMALRRSKFSNEKVTPAVLKIDIDIDIQKTSDVIIKEFKGCTYEWKEFVFNNRIGLRFIDRWGIKTTNHNLDSKYDIVIDETADNDVTAIISKLRYERNACDLKEEIMKVEKADNDYWDKQISVHTKKGCSRISSIEIC